MKRLRRWLIPVLAVPALLALVVGAACGGDDGRADPENGGAVDLRLGFFANVTHAPALVGVETGIFAESLGAQVELETTTFNAGPSVIEALFAGAIDIAYIGPNPAINGYVQSNGEALRIIAGAASAGAALVVRPESGINTPADFAGKKVATPQLGNTQDVALRAWLIENGLKADAQGGNVRVLPTANADTLTLFAKGDIDAAWVPEPWATRLILEAGGVRFLDERELWPDGKFVTTHIIVRTGFLEEHPDAVERFLGGHVRAIQRIQEDSVAAQATVNAAIERLTTAALPPAVIEAAWQNLEFTWDPLAATLRRSADSAFELGFLGNKAPDLEGIYHLELLNSVLSAAALPPVAE